MSHRGGYPWSAEIIDEAKKREAMAARRKCLAASSRKEEPPSAHRASPAIAHSEAPAGPPDSTLPAPEARHQRHGGPGDPSRPDNSCFDSVKT